MHTYVYNTFTPQIKREYISHVYRIATYIVIFEYLNFQKYWLTKGFKK